MPRAAAWEAFAADPMGVAITIAILSVLLSALSLYFSYFKEYIDVPRMAVSFDPELELHVQGFTQAPNHPGLSKWLRIRVVNVSRWKSIKNCRAFLVGFEQLLPNGQREDLFGTDSRQLIWMHDRSEHPQGRDLLPRIPHWFDVVATFDGGRNAAKARLQCFPGHELPQGGKYRLKIQVSAENAANWVVMWIDVIWNGGADWQSLDAKLVDIKDRYG